MILRRSIRRFVAYAAAFAIALQAFWPLLAQARPQDPSVLVPVCTVDGITHYLDLKPGKTPLDERSAKHGEHCKLCVFGDSKDVALVASEFQPFPIKNYSEKTSKSLKASLRLATRLPAQPRAPPQFS